MFNNLRELIATMPDEKACRDYLVQQRWNGNIVCPYCGFSKVYVIENGKRFKCADRANCAKKFTCTVGTIMEASNISISKWLMAIYICSAHKKGISSYQLGRDLGISQKSSWFMLHRIRHAFGSGNESIMLDNQVQADESYFGGHGRNKHNSKKSYDENGKYIETKVPVLGLLETGGNVKAKAVNAPTKKNAESFIQASTSKGITLVTDYSPIYTKLGKRYQHIAINHSNDEYVVNGYHVNGIENYWSVVKRGIFGIYHQVTPKHLQAYLDEYSFRFNSRKIKDSERFKISLGMIQGRLKYKTLIARPTFPVGGEDIEPIMEE